ncbi:MAG: hypothetical protein GY941_16420 [Planctomycetes bacterium]|nr:hypothetical protein [Planctomycetota bacterium]
MRLRKREFPYEGEVYRSEYERKQAKLLVKNGVEFEYERTQLVFSEKVTGGQCAECSSTKVRKRRKYTPDFYFPTTDIFVETKGKFDAPTRTKMKNVCEQSGRDVRMVFMRDNYLTRKRKMKYSRWCEINNIKYAIGDIPLEWGLSSLKEG